MAWVLLDDNFPNHPKAVAAGPVASYLFICGLCYCRKYHTGGFIAEKAIASLGVSRKPVRMIASLIAAGLWDQEPGGFRVHGYDSFYADGDDKAAKSALSQIRRDAGRKGGLSRSVSAKQNGDFASSKEGSGTERFDLVLEEKKESAFDVFWLVYPKKDGRQAAHAEWMRIAPDEDVQRQILADLEIRCRSAQWTKDKGQFIPHARTYLHQQRWKDGFTEDPQTVVSGAVSDPMQAWLAHKGVSE